MFSFQEKRIIARAIENTIKALNHPAIDNARICFQLHVCGKDEWEYADIEQNKAEHRPSSTWNERAREWLTGGAVKLRVRG
jgi:hypothetical protein